MPVLPQLRTDLEIFETAPTLLGGTAYVIYDPVRHRYFQISQSARELLRVWRAGPVSLNAKRMAHALACSEKDAHAKLLELLQFVHANSLTETPPQGDARNFAKQLAAQRRNGLSVIAHKYLFFRVPLFRPQAFLEATYPIVAFVYTRAFLVSLAVISFAGLYLAARQWERFVHTFMDFFSLQGLAAYAIGLVFVKALHELGHAYTAIRHGVRVNTMGIAFMVLMPILYTDVTDAWRLKSRRAQFQIGAAGMVVELMIAGLATVFWVFLPDGPMRSVAFVLATTSWMLSVLVNLNPLMRFDGYYLLSDAWGIPNLQPRAFALGRWKLREVLFGLGEPPPEPMPRHTRRMILVYGYATWIYRFFLFIGIALLVYHMFFKLLGVILFVVEIFYFIALPIGREIKEWWTMRKKILSMKRSAVTGLVLAALAVAFFLPWSGTIRAPALVVAQKEMPLYSPRPARLAELALADGARISAGQTLVRLEDPDLSFAVVKADRRIALIEARLARIAGDPKDRSERAVLESELRSQIEARDGYVRQMRRLVLVVPFAGTVRDVDPMLQSGRWVGRKTRLATVVSEGAAELRAYVEEESAGRLAAGATAVFIPEDPEAGRVAARLQEVSNTGIAELEFLSLASVFGGPVASDRNKDGRIEPRKGQRLIRLATDAPLPPRVMRGTVHIEGAPESIAAAVARRILQVLVRESSL